MYKNFRYTLFACLSLSVLITFQPGCKKHDKFPAQALPKITLINPSSAMPGTSVDIKGVNLSKVTAIRFGTTEAIFNAPTDTSIQAIVPDSLPPGNVYVQVYVGDGEAYAAKSFTILEIPKIPTIANVDPAIALPGDMVTINGVNFINVTSVTIGSISAVYDVASDTKINVTIPSNAEGGKEIITVSAPTGSDTISLIVDLSPVVSSFTPDQAHEGDVITVTGVRFTGATSVMLGSLSTTFTVADDNTITFTIPTGATSGNIAVTTPKGTGTSSTALTVLAAGLALPIYDDVVTSNWTNSGWIGGGWGGTADYANTSQVESGTHSVKIDYSGGYGSPMQLGGASVDVTPYTSFKISIYGAPGSGGKQINLGINQADKYTITVVEGQWTDYQIPISNLIDLLSTTILNEIWLKEYSNTGGFTVYVDNMGLN